jgi:hypothetical protein
VLEGSYSPFRFSCAVCPTVVMKDVYRAKEAHTTGLLSTFMGPNLEAFVVLTYTNNFDRSHRNSRPKVKMKQDHSRTFSTLS